MYKTALSLIAIAALGVSTSACSSSSSAHRPAASAAVTPKPSTAPSSLVADLLPTGALRLATPATSPILAHGDPPTGVGVALISALASRLGVVLTTTIYPNPPAVLAAAHIPGWDVALLPMLPATTAAADFTTPLFLVPHTLLVRAGSPITTLAQADQPGVRIASEADATHTGVLAGLLHHATLVRVDNDTEALAMLKAGQVDAFADARPAMTNDQSQVPGSSVLDQDFFTIRFGIAIPRNHAATLAWLTAFVEQLKASGQVTQVLKTAHLIGAIAAPTAGSSPTTSR
jgi:polar amino acid transport system substrate-binding protein